MTTVGKILVIVIMVFSLFFLALSTVVLTTSQNWKTEVTKLNEAKTKLEGDVKRAQAERDTQTTNLATAKNEYATSEAKYKAENAKLTEDIARNNAEVTKQRVAVETALQEVAKSQAEAEARISEANVLRQNLKTVQDQRDEFKLQQVDLSQQIVILKRELAVATDNNKNLRDRVALLQSGLKKANLSANPDDYRGGVLQPPDVEGVVTKVDASNKLIEISIGSNDGLLPTHTLSVYRTTPVPSYVGEIKILETDPNQSSARVVKTFRGLKLQEGDVVTSKIKRGS